MSLNNVCIMGRLVADPDLRHTANNVAVATVTLAVDRDIKDKNGERGTDFIPVVCWRHHAEFLSRFFSKGKAAVVRGRLQVRTFTDNSGNKRYITEVVAENIYFADNKTAKTDSAPNDNLFPVDDDDDDIPF